MLVITIHVSGPHLKSETFLLCLDQLKFHDSPNQPEILTGICPLQLEILNNSYSFEPFHFITCQDLI